MDSKTNKITKINPYYHPACVTHAHVAWATGLEAPATKKPHSPVMGSGDNLNMILNRERLLTATEDQGESTETE